MSNSPVRASRYGLDNHGIHHTGRVYWNLTTAHLYEEAVKRSEGIVAHGGALVVETGSHTGRSPNDKFVVEEPTTRDDVWWGKENVQFDPEHFSRVHERVQAYLQDKDLFVQDLLVGADPKYQRKVRFICELAWHNLFVRSLFLRPPLESLPAQVPDFTVIAVPNFYAEPDVDHTRTDCFILVDLAKRLILIGGTHYAGEMKKSIFTCMNYVLPKIDVLTMHCSCNYGKDRDVALFFGLSGTGKTTLSADPNRYLIGDDEHAWSDEGVFNLEGGCYAKVIHLSEEQEPQIWAATHSFGTAVENVILDPDTRIVDYDDGTLTENTRAAYPLASIPNCDLTGRAGHPQNIVFLTCDAFGVMPPVARLSREEAQYHFLSGYTARVAGTVADAPSEPQATFSTCFGSPFLVLHPSVYAKQLGERIEQHDAKVWLINTGWTGGPAVATGGQRAGRRIKLPYTRAIVDAALSGALNEVEYRRDPVFNVDVPVTVPNVPSDILNPRSTWPDQDAYDRQASAVAKMFQQNFAQFEAEVPDAVKAAGPVVAG